MFVHDDVVRQILQWLPVISLLRFKLVCRTWRAMIESNNFIKQHLRHHHYNPDLKGENHSLIRMVERKKSPFTFPLILADSFEEPYACVQLELSYMHKYFPLEVQDAVSYNGIICFSFENFMGEYSICLWNPATRQSRVLPQSPAFTLEMETLLGFGFDVRKNECKVVSLCRKFDSNEGSVEMYSSGTDSWSSVTTFFPFRWGRSSRIPFNNGTCFFWSVDTCDMILCIDFSSEKFRFIPFPNVGYRCIAGHYAIVSSDKIACITHRYEGQTIWVLNGYGSVNESWVKLYTVDPLSTIRRGGLLVKWLFINEKHVFFKTLDTGNAAVELVYGYNVVTKELKNLSIVKEPSSNGLTVSWAQGFEILVDFKESLLSVGKGLKEIITS